MLGKTIFDEILTFKSPINDAHAMKLQFPLRILPFLAILCAVFQRTQAAEPNAASGSEPVSFYKQIRPVFQANCQGCHQPAKPKGSYVLTEHDKLFVPGESGEKPVVPGKPEASLLFKQITPVKGEAEMPKGKPPLTDYEVGLVKQWIAQGAVDDTPANARQRYDAEHPPVYTRPPVITALDYSKDGSLIAVAGFHEVLLHKADGSGLAGRLVGLSERVQSIRFSPDGKQLAVAGGHPSRVGEVQIWDVEKRKLLVSAPVGYDTVYGVSWSPDGKLVSFGCPDKTVRAIEASSGKQVLQQGSHNDWVIDTAFTTNGAHVISVGRDMTAKLTELATERFIDNITSITPGALRGGIQAVARHPSKDQILVGGSDGIPQIFQVFRQTARKIGDNANLLRKFPAMEGRLFSVAYSPEGARIVAGASLDGHGEVRVFEAIFDATISTNILKAYEKTASDYTTEEKAAIEKFVTSEIKQTSSTRLTNSAVYAVTFSPDGKHVAAGGSDGKVRLIDPQSGAIVKEFEVVDIQQNAQTQAAPSAPWTAAAKTEGTPEPLPQFGKPDRLEVQPRKVSLSSRNEHVQLLLVAHYPGGETADVTRLAKWTTSEGIGDVNAVGRFSGAKSGTGTVQAFYEALEATSAVEVTGFKKEFDADFVHDVTPVLAKLGCSAGTCHGAKDGKNGFKLSLRGYDPIFDVRAIADDLAARRINLASPDDSQMLLKATGAVPHEGGQRTQVDSEYYAILRQWIAGGAKLNTESPRVSRIEVFPKDPVVQNTGARQQMRIVATYSDGKSRDVTSEAFIETGNGDVASTDSSGMVTALRRGEAPILARFEGSYAATTVTVMGDRSGFVWAEQPAYNKIDELVAAKWKRMKILPSGLCSDTDFIRRVSLDLTGLPPTADDVRAFLEESKDSRGKREGLIDRLIASPDFVDHWSNKWADLLQVNRKFLGEEGAQIFRDWIRKEIDGNTPYDQFVRKILTASGSNKENPASSYFKVLRAPAETMENTTHLFLGTRFNCNKCHDHPFERWTQDQYYQMAAFFAHVDLKKDDASGDRKIGGTAVEGAKPLYEIVSDKTEGDVKHDRTGKVTPPDFPYQASFELSSTNATRRQKLASWMTSPSNRYFATSYVNRIWGYLLGVGLIEPLDDIRAGNPPSNPELLEHLTREFVEHGFNTRHLLRVICLSRTYQLTLASHEWNMDDKINYSHALPRRLPAEVLLDSVFRATGGTPQFPGIKRGTRAAQLSDSAVDLPSGFLANLGRPARESACECERSNDIRLGSVMSLLSGPGVSTAVHDPSNDLARIVKNESDDRKVVEEVFLRILNRFPSSKETDNVLANATELDKENTEMTHSLAKAETAWTSGRASREKTRSESIARTERALAAHLADRAPKIAAAERSRLEAMASAEFSVQEFEPSFATRTAEWERQMPPERFDTVWMPMEITEVRGSGTARLEKLPDGSIRSTGSKGELPEYVIQATTGLNHITGIKLEVLPDPDVPFFGPGYKDGNFLLSEFVVESASKSEAPKFVKADISEGVADFVEKGQDLKHSFDGKIESGRKEGWAVGGAAGEPHWASFAFKKPITETNATLLKITLHHRYEAPYEIGRFKLWISTSPKPAAEGLSNDVAEALKNPMETRSSSLQSRILTYRRDYDPEMRRREQALSTAKAPLTEDLKVKDLQLELTRATRPVLTDPALVQLRQDAQASTRQLGNRRLTSVQDLAWALINTPSFLFNR